MQISVTVKMEQTVILLVGDVFVRQAILERDVKIVSVRSFITNCISTFILTAICNPSCQNGGECTSPNSCLCRDTYTGAICDSS